MYMISDTVAGNDPRLTPGTERIYSNWEYTSYFIPSLEAAQPFIDSKEALIVDEDVARALKFASVKDGKISFRTGTLSHEEAFGESTEPDGEKTYYNLTPEDFNNLLEALKTEMRIYLNRHFIKIPQDIATAHAGKKTIIETEINNCSNIDEAFRLMHTRFGVDTERANRSELGEAKFDLSEPGRDNWS